MIKKKPEYKQNKYASVPTSIITAELTKEYFPESLNRSEKKIEGKSKEMDCGVINMLEKREEIDEYSVKTDKEILKQFSNIGLSREEFQIYLAIFDLYLANSKKDVEKPVLISVKDFHNNILGNKNRLRKSNVDRYNSIFRRLTNKYIKINTSTANIYPYKLKSIRELRIESIITNVAILKLPKYKDELIKIFPTEYMLLERRQVKQISNYMPREFITLDFDKHDNILFFGYYLVKMHKINVKNNNNSCFEWEISINNLLTESLPNARSITEQYILEKEHKTQYINREILLPLEKALQILLKHGYILKYEFKNINKRYVFDDNQKININFNYDKLKFN